MATLEPVAGNPFATAPLSAGAPGLEPVEGDPFASGTDKPLFASGPSLEPVEGDPFQEASPQEAPATKPYTVDTTKPPEQGEALAATWIDSVLRGVDQMQGNLYAGVEGLAASAGMDDIKKWGEEGRIRNEAEAKAYGKKQELLNVGGPGDFLQWLKETSGEILPMAAPSLGGGLAGAGLGALVAGPPGALVGGIAGAAAPGFVQGVGEVQSAAKEKSPQEQISTKWLLGGGAAIAALDSIVPAKIGTALVRRFGHEVAETIAETALSKPVRDTWWREVGKTVGIEGITEAVQEAIGEVAASGGLDQMPDWKNLPGKMVEAGAAGMVGGGMFGAGARVIASGASRKGEGATEYLDDLQTTPMPKEWGAMQFDETHQPVPYDDVLAAQQGLGEYQVVPKVDARLLDILGPSLYEGADQAPAIAVKEMLQNAYDAVKMQTALDEQQGKQRPGYIDIDTDWVNRTITFYDNGTGMSPEIATGKFFDIAGTGKDQAAATAAGERYSGGFGISKLQWAYTAEELVIKTLNNGIYTEISTSGKEVENSLREQKPLKNVRVQNVSQMPASEKKNVTDLFPDGSGTQIKIKTPKNLPFLKDRYTNEPVEVNFPSNFEALKRSPLFRNILVTHNGKKTNIGAGFPIQDYSPMATVKFDWGDATIYVSKSPLELVGLDKKYKDNLHVLSEGIWQFSGSVRANPLDVNGDIVPRDFYLDIRPSVPPSDRFYPFNLNRQSFRKSAQEDINKYMNYLSVLYSQLDFGSQVVSYGGVQHIARGAGGNAVVSPSMKLEPPVPTRATPANMIREGDQIEVRKGALYVNGRETPVLSKEDLEKVNIKLDELTVPQALVPPNNIIIHDNVEVLAKLGDNDFTSLVEWGRKRYPVRFDNFLLGIGEVFRDLRDLIVHSGDPSYAELAREPVGLSFDEQYRGVSTRVPYRAAYVNPARPVKIEKGYTGLAYFYTMFHELGHYKVRNEHELTPEVQHLMAITEGPQRDALAQRIREHTDQYLDIVETMNDLLNNQPKRAIGNRLKGVDRYQERDGPISPDLRREGFTGGSGGIGPELRTSSGAPQGVAFGQGLSPEALRIAEQIKDNERAMQSIGVDDFPATPFTTESAGLRQVFQKSGAGSAGRAAAAAVDRFVWMHNYILSLVQVAARNAHIPFLQRYNELWHIKQQERFGIMSTARDTLMAWRKLGKAMADNLTSALDDYANMRYLTPDEVRQGITRMPTDPERARIFNDNKLNPKAQLVFDKVIKDFEGMLLRYEQLLLAEAKKISNPAAQATRIAEIATLVNELKKTPYFPSLWFGQWTLTVKNASGEVIFFSTFETKRDRDQAYAKQQRGLKPGETSHKGFAQKSIQPLIGMPPGLFDQIATKLNLSDVQRSALEQLRYEMAPAQGFRRHLLPKKRTPGYSQDFMRAYASYFFHGSNYFTNLKYVDPMKAQIYLTKDSAKSLKDGTNRERIGYFMENHLNYMLNPKQDWSTIRAMTFLWALGFSPAAATLNLSQLIVGSYPFLARSFGGVGKGDVRAMKAIAKASSQLSTYYKRGTLQEKSGKSSMSEWDMKALSEGVKGGIVTEALAPELAATAEGNNLGLGFGGNPLQRSFHWLMRHSAVMFELAEQTNRRVTFRAAWSLALDALNSPNPKKEAKYVYEAVQKHSYEHARLLREGWDWQHASAFVAAKDAVEATQFIYQQYAQPWLMRGHLRTVFIFKSFVQNTLFMMWNYPAAGVRAFLLMGILGGMMGVPGAEDLRGLIKAIAWQIFGKDFDLEDEARKLVLELLGDKVPPDLILHGAARRGFGLPAVMEGVGVPWPTFDRSRAIGLGSILPLDLGATLGPSGARDQPRAMAEGLQKASGAAFGVWFNMYKALTDAQMDWDDSYRWMKAMPRAAASANKGWKAWKDGEIRNRAGNAVQTFDVHDPVQMAEAIGMGLGYQPFRLSRQWDRIIAEREAVAFWDIRREMLLRQLWHARQSGDKDDYQSVIGAIRKYNGDLPTEARGKVISADTIRNSFQARLRTERSQESGVPGRRGDVPIVRKIQELYPEADVSVRRVR